MSLVTQTTDQLRETLMAMPLQSRIISGLLVAAIGIGLAFLVQSNGANDYEPLFGGRYFGESELDEVELSFASAGLNGWKREGRRLVIPMDERDKYYAALEASTTLPMSLRTNMKQAIDSGNPLESNEQRLSREMHAKEQDMGSKIALFPDVRWASVEYDRGDRRGMSLSRPQSASVVVTPEGLDPLSRVRMQQIKDLVAGSYAGMSVDDVKVIDFNASTSLLDAEDADPLLKKGREAEAMMEQKVKSLLIGYGSIRVSAFADIDPTMDIEKTMLKYDAERTTTSESSRKSEVTNTRPVNQGVPGVVPNAVGNRSASIDTTAESNREKEEERESNGVVGQQYENSREASLQIRQMKVVVYLPTSYYQKVWPQVHQQKNPGVAVTETPPMLLADLQLLREETVKNIKTAVTSLLPDVDAGKDRFPLVEVLEYPDLPEQPGVESNTADAALTWLANSWQSVALIGLALVALLVARSAIRSTTSTPSDFSEGFGLELPAPPPVLEDDVDSNDRMTITGGSLKSELVDLVERNPEVAANVIRGWVGEAA